MTNKTTSGTIEVNHETGEHYIEIPAADWDAWTVIVDGEEIEMVLDFVEDDPNGDDAINIVTDWEGKPADLRTGGGRFAKAVRKAHSS